MKQQPSRKQKLSRECEVSECGRLAQRQAQSLGGSPHTHMATGPGGTVPSYMKSIQLRNQGFPLLSHPMNQMSRNRKLKTYS